MEARHENGIATDNRAENLSWGTPFENTQDKYRHGTVHFGEKHHNAILTEEQVREIRKRKCEGQSYNKIGRDFGIGNSHVRDIIKRKIWAQVA